jgi:hypothetical protein
MAALLVRARSDPFRTRRLLDRLGWHVAGARLQPSRTAQKRHGDFGEVLAVAMLNEFQGIDVPVVKLRYQIDPEQTQPGTDIVGFVFSESDNSIDRLEFVEVKVRTSRGANTVRDAHQQLLEDAAKGFVETLDFLHQRISDDNPDLLDTFENYLADERDGRLDSYRISVVVDVSFWREEWLDRLPDEEDLVRPLTIDICQVENLADLISRSWDTVHPDVIVELTDHPSHSDNGPLP